MTAQIMREFSPTWENALLGAALGFIVFCVAGTLAAVWHQRGGRTGDTRKLFHFLVFNAAAILRLQGNSGGLICFGVIIAGGIVLVCGMGKGNRLFEALARPSDEPRRQLHVIVPMLSTAVGGVLAQLIAGRLAIVAYLIGGWGDAVGEPVGIRYGIHRYTVPSLGGVPATRSWEGSGAVFLASSCAAMIGLLALQVHIPTVVVVALFLGAATTVVEAVSPHGMDNLTILVTASWIVVTCIPPTLP